MKETAHKYQFTAMPVNLTLCMDNNCRSMLFTLLQLSSYYAKDDGWFFRTNEDLKTQANLSDKVVRAVISTFHRIGLLEVKSVGQSNGKAPNYFRLLTDKFMEWEKHSIEDCMKNPAYKIVMDDYKQTGWKPSYLISDVNTNESTEIVRDVAPSPYNIENVANIDNLAIEENTDNKLSAGVRERISSNPKEIRTTALADYKTKEDALMDEFYNTLSWSDWLILWERLEELLATAQSDHVREHTMQRYWAIAGPKIEFFKQKYASVPDNPIGRRFFKWLIQQSPH